MSAYASGAAVPELRRRQPTGGSAWPIIVLLGGPSSGKTYEAARFAADPRLGEAMWIEYGPGNEGRIDAYKGVFGRDVTILDHDGTYDGLYEQIAAARDEARRAHHAGDPPCSLTVDVWSPWNALKTWTHRRALLGTVNALPPEQEFDLNAPIAPAHNLWTDSNERYRRLMTLLITFPGPVVLTVRGEWTTTVPEVGPTVRTYELEHAHRTLLHDATVVVRLTAGSNPLIVKVDSPRAGYDTHLGPYEVTGGLDLGDLVFNRLGVQPNQPPRVATTSIDRVPQPRPAGRFHYRTQNTIGQGDGQGDGPPALPQELRLVLGDKDWLALLERRRGDVVLLKELWTAANLLGVNEALMHRIGAAGREARDALERAQQQAAAEAAAAEQQPTAAGEPAEQVETTAGQDPAGEQTPDTSPAADDTTADQPADNQRNDDQGGEA